MSDKMVEELTMKDLYAVVEDEKERSCAVLHLSAVICNPSTVKEGDEVQYLYKRKKYNGIIRLISDDDQLCVQKSKEITAKRKEDEKAARKAAKADGSFDPNKRTAAKKIWRERFQQANKRTPKDGSTNEKPKPTKKKPNTPQQLEQFRNAIISKRLEAEVMQVSQSRQSTNDGEDANRADVPVGKRTHQNDGSSDDQTSSDSESGPETEEVDSSADVEDIQKVRQLAYDLAKKFTEGHLRNLNRNSTAASFVNVGTSTSAKARSLRSKSVRYENLEPGEDGVDSESEKAKEKKKQQEKGKKKPTLPERKDDDQSKQRKKQEKRERSPQSSDEEGDQSKQRKKQDKRKTSPQSSEDEGDQSKKQKKQDKRKTSSESSGDEGKESRKLNKLKKGKEPRGTKKVKKGRKWRPRPYDGDMFRVTDPQKGVELGKPGSGLYCTNFRFSAARDSGSAGAAVRNMMDGVFTVRAMQECSLTGLPPRGKGRDHYSSDKDKKAKPFIDQEAIQSIIDTALKWQTEGHWKPKRDARYLRSSAVSVKLCEMNKAAEEQDSDPTTPADSSSDSD